MTTVSWLSIRPPVNEWATNKRIGRAITPSCWKSMGALAGTDAYRVSSVNDRTYAVATVSLLSVVFAFQEYDQECDHECEYFMHE